MDLVRTSQHSMVPISRIAHSQNRVLPLLKLPPIMAILAFVSKVTFFQITRGASLAMAAAVVVNPATSPRNVSSRPFQTTAAIDVKELVTSRKIVPNHVLLLPTPASSVTTLATGRRNFPRFYAITATRMDITSQIAPLLVSFLLP